MDTKQCPYCAEVILLAAIKCKHCGEFFAGRAASHHTSVSAPPDLNHPASVAGPSAPPLSLMHAFRNPSNGHVEQVPHNARCWVFLFGPLYFAVRGIWAHFLALAAILSVISATGAIRAASAYGSRADEIQISHFIVGMFATFVYGCFAKDIVRAHYLKLGWIPIFDSKQEIVQSMPSFGAIRSELPPSPYQGEPSEQLETSPMEGPEDSERKNITTPAS